MGASDSKYIDAQVKKTVEDMIMSNYVVVFSQTFCPASKIAKNVFKKLRAKFFTVELNYEKKQKEMFQYLQEITCKRSTPFIFIGGKSIGGAPKLKRLQIKGNLAAMLEYAGAL